MHVFTMTDSIFSTCQAPPPVGWVSVGEYEARFVAQPENSFSLHNSVHGLPKTIVSICPHYNSVFIIAPSLPPGCVPRYYGGVWRGRRSCDTRVTIHSYPTVPLEEGVEYNVRIPFDVVIIIL